MKPQEQGWPSITQAPGRADSRPATWNEKVTPGGDLRASYALSTPDWTTIESSAKQTGTGSYSINYKLRVTMLIDGTEVTLESDDLQREPEVAT